MSSAGLTLAGMSVGIMAVILSYTLPWSALTEGWKPTTQYAYGEAYLAGRDLDADWAHALAMAQKSQRQLLVIIGADWCRSCRALDRLLLERPALARAIARRYVILRLYYDEEDPAEALSTRCGDSPVGFPYFCRFTSHGGRLEAKSAALFWHNEAFDEAALRAFLLN